MRAPLRTPPWENPRRSDAREPGSRHAGARAFGPILSPMSKKQEASWRAGERAWPASPWRSPLRRSSRGRSPPGRRAPPADAPAPACAPVVVTATRTEESPFDVPASIDRIGADDDPRRPPAGQHLREPGRRARPARARPPELRAGRADLGARLRRALDLRHPRRAPLRRRHPGDAARRPGPDHQRRPRLGRPHRGAARAVLGALRQLLGRRDPGVHRRGQRPADASAPASPAGSYGALRFGAKASGGDRRLRLRRQRQHLPHRRLPRAQRGRAQHRQRQARPGSDDANQRDAGRQQRRLAEGAGSARPDARPVRRRSARRRSGRRSRSTRARRSTRRSSAWSTSAGSTPSTRCARWSTAATAAPSSSRRSRSGRRRARSTPAA